ncbi:unnamed protein product [Arabidopsis thaliana]|uniref:(thale cress) hypothetical protein n=1 Tax=Arabidopsis thaliana TaxID=3702 RepID=A0A7G2FHN2_ARATH|nr:unnamed protein product [Arabidopsis thaliana]
MPTPGSDIKGNMVIDSGTTVTLLPGKYYFQIESAVASLIDAERSKDERIEILKSDAACFTFLGECGPEPFTGSNADCLACCVALYKSPPVCAGRVEGVPAHCHCYKS